MRQDSDYHTLSLMSHKSSRPAKNICAAEILATSKALDKDYILSSTLTIFLYMDIPLVPALDTKGIHTSLSTQRNYLNRSIRSYVNCIRFELENGKVYRITWIPGEQNLADPSTKTDSSLTQALHLMMCSGMIPLQFPTAESISTDKFLG